MRSVFLLLIRGYQLAISPLFPASCRYYPTCSAYALEAFERHGVIKGIRLTISRILRCHPFRPGGHAPVPWMDKCFFRALFLSLIVIAVSQLLFPTPKTSPGSRVPPAGDSSSRPKNAALPATASSTSPNASTTPPSVTRASPTSTQAAGQGVTETVTVNTPKAIYKFTNVGAAPVSIVMRDYVNRTSSGGLVDLAA